MGLFYFALLFLVTATLANDQQQKKSPELEQLEEFQREVLKNFNETNQRIEELTKLSDARFQKVMEILVSKKCAGAWSNELSALSNGKKYLFSYSARYSWKEANEICANKGLHLVTLQDLDELRLLRTEATRLQPGQSWWVSAKKDAGQTDFTWLNGTKLGLDSNLWKEGADTKYEYVYFYSGDGDLGNLDTTPSDDVNYIVCQLPTNCY
ncbi:killer cell lectin-like receptor subfamily B member 1A [Neocloeon triangulifer]|uniref:killer cell lectin-like receptor subfamily B member 1A n=1 Tax=Neocloeon triangulifer TaxID=2078957 RepID=UPI00286F54EB|nr:killer cell lectin-like receptor subfamily B member 1A [Neocloeon triangulifer]